MAKRMFIIWLLALVGMTVEMQAQTYGRGDVNGDGEVTLADLTKLASILVGRHEYVDLALPSGTLWATTNIGAYFPEDNGLYFSFGEVAEKEEYSWSTYKWCNGTNRTLTKYCHSQYYGTVDNRQELEMEDDAASDLWGVEWYVPADWQFEEILNTEYVTPVWTTLNGVKGLLVTSLTNGNSIFLPAAGYRSGLSTTGQGNNGIYRSRTVAPNNPCNSKNLFFSSNSKNVGLTNYDYGLSVRPVRDQ